MRGINLSPDYRWSLYNRNRGRKKQGISVGLV